jgi:hypothetical protein
MTTYKRHALSQIFPDMPADEVQALADDIAANGQHEAVWLFKGTVLDGWQRYQACLLAGKNPRFMDYRGTKPAAFVKSKNWHRRHMTASQRALAVVQLAQWADSGNPIGRGAPGAPMTVAKMAETAGTKGRTIQQAKAVESSGSAALKEQVKAGNVSVKKASKVAKLPKNQQVKALADFDLSADATKGMRDREPQNDHGDAGEVDLVAELEHAHAEILKLTAQVESLSKSDVGKEALKWQKMFYELEGRLHQCMATKGEAEKQAKYSSGELAKIRKLLSVERNGDICRAIMELKR